jgi:hypothetical protein
MQTPGGQDHQQFDVAKIKIFSGSMSSFLVLFFSFASSLLLGRCRGLVYNVIHHSDPALGSTAMTNPGEKSLILF